MADSIHPQATHNLPIFITAPGDTDVTMVCTALFLLGAVIAFGVFYFRLHSLPEHIAHKADKVQMEIVSVLCLIALFTHEHIYWIAGLLLAFIDIPDFGTPLRRIAGSVARIAGGPPPDATAEIPLQPTDAAKPHGTPDELPMEPRKAKHGAAAEKKPAVAAAASKEPSHV